MVYRNLNSYVIDRLPTDKWRVFEISLTGQRTHIADFEGYEPASEWVSWKQGVPRINPYSKSEPS